MPHSYDFYTCYFTFEYRSTRHIFLIPDDAVIDRRKLGFWILIFTIVLGLISTLILLSKMPLKDNIQRS